jgi:Amino acid permease
MRAATHAAANSTECTRGSRNRALTTALNITGAKVMARVAQFGVYVEILGTLGVAIALAIHGFHHGFSYLFTTSGAASQKTNALGLDFGGSHLGVMIVAVLVPVYIFFGFESAGDVSEETKDAGRQVPRAMRYTMIWGGLASLILTAALILAIPGGPKGFTLGKWAWPVYLIGAAYLLVILVDIVAPTGLSSPRAFMNLDWITLVVMMIVLIVGAVFFLLSRGGKALEAHMRDDTEKPAAVRSE